MLISPTISLTMTRRSPTGFITPRPDLMFLSTRDEKEKSSFHLPPSGSVVLLAIFSSTYCFAEIKVKSWEVEHSKKEVECDAEVNFNYCSPPAHLPLTSCSPHHPLIPFKNGQTLSANANPLDLFDQPLLLDMIFLGTPQLCGGVDILFFFKVSFEKHPNIHIFKLKQFEDFIQLLKANDESRL